MHRDKWYRQVLLGGSVLRRKGHLRRWRMLSHHFLVSETDNNCFSGPRCYLLWSPCPKPHWALLLFQSSLSWTTLPSLHSWETASAWPSILSNLVSPSTQKVESRSLVLILLWQFFTKATGLGLVSVCPAARRSYSNPPKTRLMYQSIFLTHYKNEEPGKCQPCFMFGWGKKQSKKAASYLGKHLQPKAMWPLGGIPGKEPDMMMWSHWTWQRTCWLPGEKKHPSEMT